MQFGGRSLPLLQRIISYDARRTKKGCRGLCSASNPILVRDFIQAALYHPQFGYFTTRPQAVGVIPEPICFSSLQGQKSYIRHLDELYKCHDISWFTPVEVFKPWYAYAVAESILQYSDPTTPLKIYEIGGGAGTCARNILDYIKSKAPDTTYKTMRYVSVEISNALAEKQAALVGEVASHKGRFHVEHRSAKDSDGWGSIDDHPCFVILFEVLDNLPHDLICRETPGSPWTETHVIKNDGRLSEIHLPLQDPLIKQFLDIANMRAADSSHSSFTTLMDLFTRYIGLRQEVWIPTGCMQLLDALHKALPNMSLIASDFSFLPDVKVKGERAPLVTVKKDGETRDYATYLEAKGDADIFFPTDFSLLQNLDSYFFTKYDSLRTLKVRRRQSSVLTSAEFMEVFAKTSETKTRSGYNPLLEDFRNTKFLLSLPMRSSS